jgi:ABC-type multidrug transport system ATPase subunit
MIRVEHLSKRFGAVQAVSDLSFEVEPGETFAIIGPNGAGKTTTLKVLLGLTRPDSGRVGIGPAGLAPSDPAARRELGYVPQRVSFTPGRTVREVLAFFADLRGLPRRAADEALAKVGLEDLATRHASQLSGGYSQRLSLAQALLGDPALLVLDEPTASLDPESTWEFRSLIERLRGEGRTILLCSHLLSEVERVADRVLILVGGRRAGLERLAELRARQMGATRMLIEVRGEENGAFAALARLGRPFERLAPGRVAIDGANGFGLEALEALRAGGVAVRSFEMQRPTLEEIFLDVVKRDRHETPGKPRGVAS